MGEIGNFTVFKKMIVIDFKFYVSLKSIANGQNLWLLSRRNTLDRQFVDRAMYVLNSNRLSTSYLKHTDQNCVQRNPGYQQN